MELYLSERHRRPQYPRWSLWWSEVKATKAYRHFKTFTMAPPAPVKCSLPGCEYETPPGCPNWDLITKQLEVHAATAHPPPANFASLYSTAEEKWPFLLGLHNQDVVTWNNNITNNLPFVSMIRKSLVICDPAFTCSVNLYISSTVIQHQLLARPKTKSLKGEQQLNTRRITSYVPTLNFLILLSRVSEK